MAHAVKFHDAQCNEGQQKGEPGDVAAAPVQAPRAAAAASFLSPYVMALHDELRRLALQSTRLLEAWIASAGVENARTAALLKAMADVEAKRQRLLAMLKEQ